MKIVSDAVLLFLFLREMEDENTSQLLLSGNELPLSVKRIRPWLQGKLFFLPRHSARYCNPCRNASTHPSAFEKKSYHHLSGVRGNCANKRIFKPERQLTSKLKIAEKKWYVPDHLAKTTSSAEQTTFSRDSHLMFILPYLRLQQINIETILLSNNRTLLSSGHLTL